MMKDKTIEHINLFQAKYERMERFLNDRGYFICIGCDEMKFGSTDGVGSTTEGLCCGICFENHPENATD